MKNIFLDHSFLFSNRDKLNKYEISDAYDNLISRGLSVSLAGKICRSVRYSDIKEPTVTERMQIYKEDAEELSFKQKSSLQMEEKIFATNDEGTILGYISLTKSPTALKRYLDLYGKELLEESDYLSTFGVLFGYTESNYVSQSYTIYTKADLWNGILEFLEESILETELEAKLSQLLAMYLYVLPNRDEGIKKILNQEFLGGTYSLAKYLSFREIDIYGQYALDNCSDASILSLAVSFPRRKITYKLIDRVISSSINGNIASLIIYQTSGLEEYIFAKLLDHSCLEYIDVLVTVRVYNERLAEKMIQYLINNKTFEEIKATESDNTIINLIYVLPKCQLSQKLIKDIIQNRPPIVVAVLMDFVDRENLKNYIEGLVLKYRPQDYQTILSITESLNENSLPNDEFSGTEPKTI